MTKPPSFYLRGAPGGWAVYPLNDQNGKADISEPLGEALDSNAVCQLIEEYIAENQSPGNAQVVIGLPASWCFCANVSVAGIPRGASAQAEQALIYRLEAALPITAEDWSVDFIGEGDVRLGVAVFSDRLIQLVHQLEDSGHTVVAITPRVFLAAQGWSAGGEVDTSDRPTTLCWAEPSDQGEGSIQLLHLASEQPPQWRNFPTPGDTNSISTDLAGQLTIDGVLALASERQWLVTQGTDQLFAFLEKDGASPGLLSEPMAAEYKAASDIAVRSDKAWVNLCRGPLAPRYHWRRVRTPALATIAAAMLLLVTLVAALLIRAGQYNQIAEAFDVRSAEAFAEAMPGQSIPTSPQRRLKAQLKRLRGESGMAGGEELQDASAPMLNVLHDLLVTLPSDQRYAITDLRLESGGLRMNGYARSHSEADQLANTLRQAGVFLVEPPSTDKLPDGGVRFSLEALHTNPSPDRDSKPQDQAPGLSESPALAERTDIGGKR